MKQTTIAIIGGGATGVATFLNLVIKLRTQPLEGRVKIVLLEKSGEFGPGLAYGSHQKGHILNTAAGLMGIFPDEPLHFVEWLQQHSATIKEQFPDLDLDENTYVPRFLYGDYVKEQLQEYLQIARQHNIEVSLQKEEVTDAAISEREILLTLASGDELKVTLAVLATGTPKPNNFPHLLQSPQYIDFPWPSRRLLQNIPKDATVAMLGTSLTAIDTVVTLTDNGHTGPMTLYSRHGLLPRVQSPFDVSFERKALTLENIRKLIREEKRDLRAKDLFRLFRADAERVMGSGQDWKEFNRIDKPHLELLEHDLELALAGKSVFQNLSFSTRYLSFEVWKLLSTDEKTRFLKWFGPHWDINRHSIPVQNARKLISLLQKGQLTVKAHSSKVEWEAGEKQFSLHLEDGSVDKAPYVVNATGTAKKVEKMNIQLLDNLLKKKFIATHQAGGVIADPNTLQLHVPAQPEALLFGAGQLLVGELFDTNSVWFNVARIESMTQHILHRLRHGGTA
ncbi:hypothetical protein FVR03_17840 [Pontibacter qinzhouensis]|uniref:FAD-dependent urate hydroxylase HpyO/Asp monooxygenase CreE-like FAD/NAD(P)-binding domain-containing protein n=1 Tax=Pontibacter qinzhouensis TaxID=2603253 RepID=A0A5C8JDF2_9BACT|nr:FAD/NAD(P)-binding protein [Pontibacter qinzhouensis]TXK36415.1 hypothetical protein FVR03_17840 [Pontibacter qinzhouensis]